MRALTKTSLIDLIEDYLIEYHNNIDSEISARSRNAYLEVLRYFNIESLESEGLVNIEVKSRIRKILVSNDINLESIEDRIKYEFKPNDWITEYDNWVNQDNRAMRADFSEETQESYRRLLLLDLVRHEIRLTKKEDLKAPNRPGELKPIDLIPISQNSLKVALLGELGILDKFVAHIDEKKNSEHLFNALLRLGLFENSDRGTVTRYLRIYLDSLDKFYTSALRKKVENELKILHLKP